MYRLRGSKRKDRALAALADMQHDIAPRYPEADFMITEGDDPPGIYLRPILETDDIFEILDVISDKLYEYKVEQRLSVYVFPMRPPRSATAAGRTGN
jgi:hypothetical protein